MNHLKDKKIKLQNFKGVDKVLAEKEVRITEYKNALGRVNFTINGLIQEK